MPGEPLTDEDITIRRQFIALFAGLLLLLIGMIISKLLSGDFKYGILGLMPAVIYIGVSSIAHRVSIVRVRTQEEWKSKGGRAVVLGIVVILASILISYGLFFR